MRKTFNFFYRYCMERKAGLCNFIDDKHFVKRCTALCEFILVKICAGGINRSKTC